MLAWSLRGHNDLCAAIRAAALAPPGPARKACFDWLLDRCRDLGRLTRKSRDVEIERAQETVREYDRSARAGRSPDGVVAMSLARMVAGELHRLVLVELGPEGLSCREILRNTDGSLRTSTSTSTSTTQHDIWAELAGDPPGSERRNFFLAGGVATDEPALPRDRDQLRTLAESYLEQRGIRATDPGSEYLLMRRVTGWRVIELLAGALRACVPATGDVILRASALPLNQLAQEWCDGAPLRHGYELAVASIDEADGRVAVSTVPVFGAGTAGGPGGDVRTSLDLARADGLPGPVTLPILIANGGPELERAQLLVGQTELPAPGPVSCHLVLRRPGQVEFELACPLEGGAAVPVSVSDTPSWPDIVRGLPAHNAFDVVVAVELSGTPDVVHPRVEVLCNLVHALRIRDAAAPGSVRVAAIRYTDHPEETSRREEPTCQVEPFTAPEAMMDPLARWQPSPPDSKYGSSVEDALHLARQLPWRQAALRCLVVIGSRPPSVTSIGQWRGSVCPHGYVWGEQLTALRAGLAVRCFAVVDEPPWMAGPIHDEPVARTRDYWRTLGADGLFSLGGFTLPELVEQLIPGPSAALPLAVLINSDHPGR